jgi:hypothetical protein
MSHLEGAKRPGELDLAIELGYSVLCFVLGRITDERAPTGLAGDLVLEHDDVPDVAALLGAACGRVEQW